MTEGSLVEDDEVAGPAPDTFGLFPAVELGWWNEAGFVPIQGRAPLIGQIAGHFGDLGKLLGKIRREAFAVGLECRRDVVEPRRIHTERPERAKGSGEC